MIFDFYACLFSNGIEFAFLFVPLSSIYLPTTTATGAIMKQSSVPMETRKVDDVKTWVNQHSKVNTIIFPFVSNCVPKERLFERTVIKQFNSYIQK